jgi:hypothetical protein
MSISSIDERLADVVQHSRVESHGFTLSQTRQPQGDLRVELSTSIEHDRLQDDEGPQRRVDVVEADLLAARRP